MGGVAVAWLPDVPRFSLDPALARALFVAPVLLDAAFDSSLRDLRANWFPVTSLILIAVSVTTGAVVLAARWLVPAIPAAVAVTLEGLLAQPETATAQEVLERVSLLPTHLHII